MPARSAAANTSPQAVRKPSGGTPSCQKLIRGRPLGWRVLMFGGKGNPSASARGVSLPPRPPIPSPARFIQEDSALRECRRIPSGNRPPVKRLHTLLADDAPQKTAGFPATPKNPHSQKSKTSARYFPYSSALSRPADFPAVPVARPFPARRVYLPFLLPPALSLLIASPAPQISPL